MMAEPDQSTLTANLDCGLDIIGDIHGHAAELKSLLALMGYRPSGRGFRHPTRKVVFAGDFVDRGPEIGQVISIARSMVEAGDAWAVMGNHEYNAIAFHTAKPGKADSWFRSRSEKNVKQHKATLEQLASDELTAAIAWFKTLPPAIELGGIRIAHAAWQTRQIARINSAIQTHGPFTAEFLSHSERRGTELNQAIETVLKGPEVRLPDGMTIRDKGGAVRATVRIKWYQEGTGRTYRQHHLGQDNPPDTPINADDLADFETYPPDAPPVFFGHYWMVGTPAPLANNVACTDYSVAKQGKLAAYRWDGESTLRAEKFVWVNAS
jgi:hypothetical protein